MCFIISIESEYSCHTMTASQIGYILFVIFGLFSCMSWWCWMIIFMHVSATWLLLNIGLHDCCATFCNKSLPQPMVIKVLNYDIKLFIDKRLNLQFSQVTSGYLYQLKHGYVYFSVDLIKDLKTHWGRGKMTAIFQTFQVHFREWKCLNSD